MVYFWLNSPELAIDRVASRVASGGHNIEEKVVRRRYIGGIHNLFSLYLPLVDYWLLIDNSDTPFEIIAEGNEMNTIDILNSEKYKTIQSYGK